MKKIFILMLLQIAFSTSKAQKILTLEECVSIAIENNIEIQRADYSAQNALYDYEQSRRNQLPDLSANTSHSLNFGRSLDPTTYQFNTNTIQSNSFGASANALLFAGGRQRNTIRLQEMLRNRSETTSEALKDQVAITVASNYMATIMAKEQIETAKTQLKLRETDFKRNELLIENGLNPGSTRYDFEAQLLDVKYSVQQAINNYELNKLALKQVLLLPYEQEIELVYPDVLIPTFDYLQEELNPNEVFSNAVLTQGSILGTIEDISIAEQRAKVAKSGLYPSISLGGGINTYTSSEAKKLELQNGIPVAIDSPFDDQFGDNISENIRLSVSIPIFNRGETRTQIKKAQNNVKQTKLDAEKQRNDLQQTIQKAYLDAKLSYENYIVATKRVETLEKTTDFAKKRFDIGSATIYDYLTSQTNFTNAKLTMTQAKYDYLYKVNVLEFYKNNKFEF